MFSTIISTRLATMSHSPFGSGFAGLGGFAKSQSGSGFVSNHAASRSSEIN
jgi:hypothetical protein